MVLNLGARFYFIIHHDENPENIFQYNEYLHRHPQVGILQKVDTLDSNKIMYKVVDRGEYRPRFLKYS